MKLFFYVLSFILFSACNGGGGCGGGTSTTPDSPKNDTTPQVLTINGVFIDSEVQGLDYTTSDGKSGNTDSLGSFSCDEGSTVTFSIGNHVLGSTDCGSVITPASLFFPKESYTDVKSTLTRLLYDCTQHNTENNCNADMMCNYDSTNNSCGLGNPLSNQEKEKAQKLVNTLTLLQSMDTDSTDDKITIPTAVKTQLNNEVLDLTKPNMGLSDVSAMITTVATNSGETLSHKNITTVLNHYENSMTKARVHGLSVTTKEDTQLSLNSKVMVTLGDKKVTSFTLVPGDTNPTKGVLSCGATCNYIPFGNTTGVDKVYVKAVVSGVTSVEFPVNVSISPVNDAPTLSVTSFTATEDQTYNFNLSANDVEGDATTIVISSNGTNGSATCSTSGVCSYLGKQNFNGNDSFTVVVSDGTDSSTQTVLMTVTGENDDPTLKVKSFSVNEDSSVSINLETVDVDGDNVSISTTSNPSKGTLSGMTYSPNAHYFGNDSFTVSLNDGNTTITETISLTINPVNDEPTLSTSSFSTNEDTSKSITLVTSDLDGDTVSVTLKTNSSNGNTTCSNKSCTYAPNQDFNGSDSFVVTLNDGSTSVDKTVSLTVNPVNDSPVATVKSDNVAKNTVRTLTLEGSDIDQDSLTYTVVSQPTNGSLSCTGKSCNYTPNNDYVGTDSFTYKVNDGTSDSNTVTYSLTIKDILLATTSSMSIAVGKTSYIPVKTSKGEDVTDVSSINALGISYTYDESSVDSSVATVQCGALGANYPAHCKVIGVASGSTSFKYKVSDGNETTDWQTVSVLVSNNPVIQSIYLSGYENEELDLDFQSRITDADGDSMTVNVNWVSQDVYDGKIKFKVNGSEVSFTGTAVDSNDPTQGYNTEYALSTTDVIKLTPQSGTLKKKTDHSSGYQTFSFQATDSNGLKSSLGYMFFYDQSSSNKYHIGVNRDLKIKQVTEFSKAHGDKLSDALNSAWPWSSVTCTDPDSTSVTFRSALAPSNGWKNAVNHDGNVYYSFFYKEVLPGVMVYVVPYRSNGSKLDIVSYTSITWDQYLSSGNSTTPGNDFLTMENLAQQRNNAFLSDTTVGDGFGFESGVSFDIKVVFSSSDVSSANVAKTTYNLASSGSYKDLYFVGEARTQNKVTLDHLCGGNSLLYRTNLDKTNDTTAWHVYGNDRQSSPLAYTQEVEVSHVWEFHEGNNLSLVMKESGVDNDNDGLDDAKYHVQSIKYPYFSTNRNKAIIFVNIMAYWDNLNNRFGAENQYPAEALIYVYTGYQDIDPNNNSNMWTRVWARDGSTMLTYFSGSNRNYDWENRSDWVTDKFYYSGSSVINSL